MPDLPYAWSGRDSTGAVVTGTGTIPVQDPAGNPAADAYGMCLVLQNSDYDDLDAVFAELDWLGVTSIRARWQSGGRGHQVMTMCADRGWRWLASFCPETFAETTNGNANGTPKFTRAQITSKLTGWLRDAFTHPAAGTVLMGLENLNEPNSVRGGGQPIADWPQRCADLADVFYDERARAGLDHLPVTTPSMHADDDNADGGGGDWRKLAAAGCRADVISGHSYPFGGYITNRLDTRIANAHSAYPGLGYILSEGGWVTSPAYVPPPSGGPQYVTPQQQATYLAAAPQQLYDHPDVVHGFHFELRDSEVGKVGVQDCRGVIRAGVWKPSAQALRDALT